MSLRIVAKPGLEMPDFMGVPRRWRPGGNDPASAVVRSLPEAEDLVAFYGRPEFCPFGPVLLIHPTADYILIAGMGEADAAELRDLAVATWCRASLRIEQNGGQQFDFGALREKRGLLPKEEAAAAMFEMIRDRRMEHDRNRRTEPPREMGWPDSGRAHFDMARETTRKRRTGGGGRMGDGK